MTSILTSITPASNLAILRNAELDKSTIRPFAKGPLSLIFTMLPITTYKMLPRNYAKAKSVEKPH